MTTTFGEAVDQRRSVDHPLSIAAGAAVMVLGSLNFPLMPMIVGAMAENLPFSTQEIGFIASADMFGMFAAALFALYWVRRWGWRNTAFAFSCALAVCHLISSLVVDFWTLALIRFLSGFCGGSLMAIGSTIIADTRNPERNVAMMTGAQMATAALGFLLLPGVIDTGGVEGVFLFLAALVLPAVAASRLIPDAGSWQQSVRRTDADKPASGMVRLAVLATLPGFLFHLAYGASWTFIERIGVHSGLSLDTVGQALSASFLAGVLGSAVAWGLGTRWGRTVPFAITITAQLLSLMTLVFLLDGVVLYVSALMVYAFFLNFPIPYQIGLAVSLDQTGRAAVLYLLMLKAGIAIAPFLAAQFVDGDNFTRALFIAALFYTLCFVHLLWLQRRYA